MIDTCTDTDIPAIAELLRDLNALHVAHSPQRFHGEGSPDALQGLLRKAREEGAEILVYRVGGVARGYLMWRIRDVPATAVECSRRLGVLDHIYVEPSWRRRGVARRLIARFEAEIAGHGVSAWITTVHSFNTASAAMMQHAGARLSIGLYEKAVA